MSFRCRFFGTRSYTEAGAFKTKTMIFCFKKLDHVFTAHSLIVTKFNNPHNFYLNSVY